MMDEFSFLSVSKAPHRNSGARVGRGPFPLRNGDRELGISVAAFSRLSKV